MKAFPTVRRAASRALWLDPNADLGDSVAFESEEDGAGQ
jgi:hypothetical protein